MTTIIIVGVILLTGLFFAEVAVKLRLPRVSGYILAGIFLNPNILPLIPQDFPQHTHPVMNILLAFITFSIGGTLLFSRLSKLGKNIMFITMFEAGFAFLAVFLGFLALFPLLSIMKGFSWTTTLIPLALLLASLASPTDPSTTLAVVHQYKAKGPVTSTIMGVAVFDDVFGIINFSLAITLARALMLHQALNVSSIIVYPFIIVAGSLLIGFFFGLAFNWLHQFIKKESEGILIVLIIAGTALCFGMTQMFKLDELLSTMTMGAVVVNFNKKHEVIFKVLERYTEELVFVLFFTLSAMHLKIDVLHKYFICIMIFFFLRFSGKVLGSFTGAVLAKADAKVRNFVFGGLIPQGGIVVGLALLIKQKPHFHELADIVINVIIGATVLYEIVGPICSRLALTWAREID